MEVMGCIVTVACVVTFFYALCGTNDNGERWTLGGLCIIFGFWIGALSGMSIAGSWEHANVALEASLLLIAALNVLYASYDIYDDTVRRKVERSDAYQCASMYPCFSARCVGATWFLLSLAATVFAVWAFLRLTTATAGPPRSIAELRSEATGYIFAPGPAVLGVALLLKLADCFMPGARRVTQQPFHQAV